MTKDMDSGSAVVRAEDICAYTQDDTLYELGASFYCPAAGCRPWFVPMPDPTIGALTAAAAEHVDTHHRNRRRARA